MQTFKIIYTENDVKKAIYVDSHDGSYQNALSRNNISDSMIEKVREVAHTPNYLL